LEIGSITGCCSCCWIRPVCGDEYGLIDHWSGIFSYKNMSIIVQLQFDSCQRILGSRTWLSSCKAVVVFVVTLILLILKDFLFFLSALKNKTESWLCCREIRTDNRFLETLSTYKIHILWLTPLKFMSMEIEGKQDNTF
jgi:hypothetical protein